MTSLLETTQYLLKKNNLSPQKTKGQNFLIAEDILEKIIQSANLKKGDNVLEIGPGIGTLTKALLKKEVNLKLIELDENLINVLKSINTIKNNRRLEIISGDVLKLNLEKVIPINFLKNYQIVANLPYNISSKFLRIFLEHKFAPQKMVLMLQKEVAERIVNRDAKWSKLSVMCNFYAQVQYLFTVSKNNFWPVPQVDSAVISFQIRAPRSINQKFFWRLVRIGFSAKRKTLVNNLSNGLQISRKKIIAILESVGLNRNIRAEKLTIEDWVKLVNSNIFISD